MVQWLRLYATNVGHQGSMRGEGTRSHMLYLTQPNKFLKGLGVERRNLKNKKKMMMDD